LGHDLGPFETPLESISMENLEMNIIVHWCAAHFLGYGCFSDHTSILGTRYQVLGTPRGPYSPCGLNSPSRLMQCAPTRPRGLYNPCGLHSHVDYSPGRRNILFTYMYDHSPRRLVSPWYLAPGTDLWEAGWDGA